MKAKKRKKAKKLGESPEFGNSKDSRLGGVLSLTCSHSPSPGSVCLVKCKKVGFSEERRGRFLFAAEMRLRGASAFIFLALTSGTRNTEGLTVRTRGKSEAFLSPPPLSLDFRCANGSEREGLLNSPKQTRAFEALRGRPSRRKDSLAEVASFSARKAFGRG